MRIRVQKHKYLSFFLAVIFTLCTTACGTIFYPERVGQEKGRIDPMVAVMDGLCVFIVIIPGLIAFIVDFATGAIYLPNSAIGQTDPDDRSLTLITVIGPQNLAAADFERMAAAIGQYTGKYINISDAGARMKLLKGPTALETAKITLQDIIRDSCRNQYPYNIKQ